jgi:hypothetical protein
MKIYKSSQFYNHFKSIIKGNREKSDKKGKKWGYDFVTSFNLLKHHKKVTYYSKEVDDLPEENEIEENIVYIIGENGYHWLAAFRCPCGCNDIIQLNLLPEAFPHWEIVSYKKKSISIIPSIERINGCKSHFNFANGKVYFWGSNSFHS